jgi:surfeit locus 1 family protein
MKIKYLIGRSWWKTTILVLIGVGILIRLGIWQLDRLEQRREFNARVEAQLERPPIKIDGNMNFENLVGMEYRSITVTGEYDHNNQVALRNQVWNNELGVHLLTPLKVDGTDYVILVNRGWIPMEDFSRGDWSKFNEPGLVEVSGMIRVSQTRPEIGRISDPMPSPDQERLIAWNLANLEFIGKQLPYQILPVYIQQASDPLWHKMPYRSLPELNLSEGSHLGYAIQWFTFAAILALGYPIFIVREIEKSNSSSKKKIILGEVKY